LILVFGALVVAMVYALAITLLWRKERYLNRQHNTIIKDSLMTHPTPLLSADRSEMSDDEYQRKADEAMRFSQTFQKFVPKQFVEHFAKHGSDALALGRADEDNVAIMFCDIRGFTGLSEKMSPQELMNFLNSYFLRMNAPIHSNNGFIDKFIGDAIMALFDRPNGEDSDKASDAIRAAMGLRKALSLYNEHRANSGYDPVDIGIGIHFGPVIIGTVGSDDRMDTTVIGDSVNIAQRLESLAPIYNIDIVVSAQLIKTAASTTELSQSDIARGNFANRVIDWVRVKGRTEPIELVEILCHLPKDMQIERLGQQDTILQIIGLRKSGQLNEALRVAHEASLNHPLDPILKHHREALERLILDIPSPEWDGALSL